MKGTTNKASNFLTKYAMVIALVIVFVLFAYLTDGRLLYAQNMSNLMLQTAMCWSWPAACCCVSSPAVTSICPSAR